MTLNTVRDGLSGLPRRWKQAILIGFDTLALLGVLWLSFAVRLGGNFTPTMSHIALMLLAPVVAIPVFIRLGLYRAVIRYLPERALWTIIQAMILATLLWVFALFLAEATRLAIFPRTVPLFYFIFGTVVVAGSRFLAKALLWLPERTVGHGGGVVIYGAGSAGTQLAEALRAHRASYVVAFIDDDQGLWGRDVAGIRVDPPNKLGELIRNRGVGEVILSIPSADATRRAQIVTELSHHPIKIRALPAIADLVSGKYLISQLREIDIDDLLGRSAVPANDELMDDILSGRVILVTGAGGSIGSELTRLIVLRRPKKLVLLEANEFALYEIDRHLRTLAQVEIVPVLGSIADSPLVRRTLRDQGVEVIFHAAAHKHVPLVEANALEGVRNNVVGTRTLVEAAVAAGVERFVLISSDKAVRPSSVMGATKRWAELIVRHYGKGSGLRYCSVRFGNVLGSNGSVVPLFREQIAAGGPVTLTDSRMTRYFMSIHEAAELIVQAGAMAEGGDIFLLEMGEPVKIRDLAENMIRLAGLSVKSDDNPKGDIAIKETGARPGEKLTEELFFDPANALRTTQPKILRSPPGARQTDDLQPALAALGAALEAEDEAELRRVLFDYVKV
ncbi:MAG TPA: nucleoside-diphosphate sugar epimerase/dehydratase [Devosia sp.]|jgi:FlaA1/EpsC-like NDP-sugar epimerase|uniref:polysaccharide biosynthesis protein n=1 Tax=Devosia sp. TaxID=1871048 RepID=UPI002DDCB4AA|nr:nucleoside-diphosphate sugar epimerase/dehydratase [Devosia sp.]HEV2513987.1 nucleoside-diphosphate sugar epimerase/dehydratase [Devosia sp.]